MSTYLWYFLCITRFVFTVSLGHVLTNVYIYALRTTHFVFNVSFLGRALTMSTCACVNRFVFNVFLGHVLTTSTYFTYLTHFVFNVSSLGHGRSRDWPRQSRGFRARSRGGWTGAWTLRSAAGGARTSTSWGSSTSCRSVSGISHITRNTSGPPSQNIKYTIIYFHLFKDKK